jgi:hypothetical protein
MRSAVCAVFVIYDKAAGIASDRTFIALARDL